MGPTHRADADSVLRGFVVLPLLTQGQLYAVYLFFTTRGGGSVSLITLTAPAPKAPISGTLGTVAAPGSPAPLHAPAPRGRRAAGVFRGTGYTAAEAGSPGVRIRTYLRIRTRRRVFASMRKRGVGCVYAPTCVYAHDAAYSQG